MPMEVEGLIPAKTWQEMKTEDIMRSIEVAFRILKERKDMPYGWIPAMLRDLAELLDHLIGVRG